MNKKQRKTIVVIFLVALIFLSVFWVRANFNVVINHSESLPINGVIIKKGKNPSKQGDLFVFWVRNKDFYKQDVKFIKKVGGFVGDELYITGEGNMFVAMKNRGFIKKKSLKGVPLTANKAQKIPYGQYYAYAEHKDSFDSRYQEIGLIDEKNIIGTAIFVF